MSDRAAQVLDLQSGTQRAGEPEEKLFLRWGIGITTYGKGPQGDHVPTAIKNMTGNAMTVEEAARLITLRRTAIRCLDP